jgi:polyisoprenoid-binding protein YceI
VIPATAEQPPQQATPATALAPAAPASPQAATAALTLTIQAGSKASYAVREQLAGRDFPSDAVGATDRVTGALAFDAEDNLIPGLSKLVVDLRGLASDDTRRDNYVRNNTLQTSRYSSAEFVPRTLSGLGLPFPSLGQASFQISGDMTIRGVTRPLTLDVQAAFNGKNITGVATASFTFADFEITKPRVFLVLSVEDAIKLKVEFTLTADASA